MGIKRSKLEKNVRSMVAILLVGLELGVLDAPGLVRRTEIASLEGGDAVRGRTKLLSSKPNCLLRSVF